MARKTTRLHPLAPAATSPNNRSETLGWVAFPCKLPLPQPPDTAPPAVHARGPAPPRSLRASGACSPRSGPPGGRCAYQEEEAAGAHRGSGAAAAGVEDWAAARKDPHGRAGDPQRRPRERAALRRQLESAAASAQRRIHRRLPGREPIYLQQQPIGTAAAVRPGRGAEEGGRRRRRGSRGAQHLPSSGAAARAGRDSLGCHRRLPELCSESRCGEHGERAGRERSKEPLPIAKPPGAASHPPPLPAPAAGEGLSRWPPGVGDTRGGAEGAGGPALCDVTREGEGLFCRIRNGEAFQEEPGGRGCPLAFTGKTAAAFGPRGKNWVCMPTQTDHKPFFLG